VRARAVAARVATAVPATSAAPPEAHDDAPAVASAAPFEAVNIELRDYQDELLAKASALFESGERAVLAYLPTGGGKTRVGAAAMSRWVLGRTRSKKSLFVVNKKTLLTQTRDALLALGFAPPQVGLIGGGVSCPQSGELADACVHVAMVQSLHEAGACSRSEADELTLCHAAPTSPAFASRRAFPRLSARPARPGRVCPRRRRRMPRELCQVVP
jgi:superfamily II DNA or RNA helicase